MHLGRACPGQRQGEGREHAEGALQHGPRPPPPGGLRRGQADVLDVPPEVGRQRADLIAQIPQPEVRLVEQLKLRSPEVVPGHSAHGFPGGLDQFRGGFPGQPGPGHRVGQRLVDEVGEVVAGGNHIRGPGPRGCPRVHARPPGSGQPVAEQLARLAAGLREQPVLLRAGQDAVFGCPDDGFGNVPAHHDDPLTSDGSHRAYTLPEVASRSAWPRLSRTQRAHSRPRCAPSI
jgi:hypothetical protein